MATGPGISGNEIYIDCRDLFKIYSVLDILDTVDFKVSVSARRRNNYFITFHFTYQPTCNRRTDRDQSRFDISLVISNNLVSFFIFRITIN